LTQSGAIVGTPAYMPPEQARGEKGLSIAADVYALGAILYEALTGQPPYRGATPLAVVLQVLEKNPVPPRDLNGKLDRDLETICLKALAREPAGRRPSPAARADASDRWLAGEPIEARPVGQLERAWRWCRKNRALAGLASLLLLSLVAGTVVASLLAIRAAEHARRA